MSTTILKAIKAPLRIVIKVIVVLTTLIWSFTLIAVVILIKPACSKVYFC